MIQAKESNKFKGQDIRFTPKALRYIKSNRFWQRIALPILQRIAWLLSVELSLFAIVPLGFKLIVNIIRSFINSSERKDVIKSVKAIVLIPMIGSVVSALSIIFPVKIGGKMIRNRIFPARSYFKEYIRTPPNVRPITQEIGPRGASSENMAFITEGKKLRAIKLPRRRSFPIVKGLDDIIIDSADLPADVLTDHYRVYFCGNGSFYQYWYERIQAENNELPCNTRGFNYPSVTKTERITSIFALVNAGIAQVYDLAERKNWSNEHLEKKLHLYGRSLGGGVALQVAAYFKEKYDLNLKVFADRTFSSIRAVMAARLNRMTGLPLWYAKCWCNMLLLGTGDWNINSVAAITKLNLEFVYVVNLGHKEQASKPRSIIQKCKDLLGIGPHQADADLAIPDGSTLMDELINKNLGRYIPVYAVHTDASTHDDELANLFLDKQVTLKAESEFYYEKLIKQNRTALSLYASTFQEQDRVMNGVKIKELLEF